jgi:hypothetical protein
MAPLSEGERDQALTSSAGGVAPRWARLSAEARPPPAQRPVDQPWRQHRATAVHAWQNGGRTPLACDAEAQQALATVAPGLQVTCLHPSAGRRAPRAGTRGRPGPGPSPDQVVSPIDGAWAAARVVRQALVTQQSGGLLAPHARDEPPRPPPELWAGDHGPVQAERGVRCRKAPTFGAAARDLNTPERSMARGMVMPGC